MFAHPYISSKKKNLFIGVPKFPSAAGVCFMISAFGTGQSVWSSFVKKLRNLQVNVDSMCLDGSLAWAEED